MRQQKRSGKVWVLVVLLLVLLSAGIYHFRRPNERDLVLDAFLKDDVDALLEFADLSAQGQESDTELDFMLSIGWFMKGDIERTRFHRSRVFQGGQEPGQRSKPDLEALTAKMRSLAKEHSESAFASFGAAVLCEYAGEEDEAAGHYQLAQLRAPENARLERCSFVARCPYPSEVLLSYRHKFEFSGPTKMLGGDGYWMQGPWAPSGPVGGERFRVNGEVWNSSPELRMSTVWGLRAQVTDWAHCCASPDDIERSNEWGVCITEGKIVVSSGLYAESCRRFGDSPSAHAQPLDYFGRYVLISIDPDAGGRFVLPGQMLEVRRR